MESPATPDKDDGIIRINRMEPGHIDVVLGSHPGRSLPRPLHEPRPYGLILLCALLAILSLCLMLSQWRRHAPEVVSSNPADRPASVAPPNMPTQADEPSVMSDAQPAKQHQ